MWKKTFASSLLVALGFGAGFLAASWPKADLQSSQDGEFIRLTPQSSDKVYLVTGAVPAAEEAESRAKESGHLRYHFGPLTVRPVGPEGLVVVTEFKAQSYCQPPKPCQPCGGIFPTDCPVAPPPPPNRSWFILKAER